MIDRIVFLAVVAFLGVGMAQANDAWLIDEMPSIYEESLKAKIVPIETVLAGREWEVLDDANGISLSRDRITYWTDDGRVYRLSRRVDYSVTQAGASDNEKMIFTFDRDRERIRLIEAYSLQANGTRLDVAENAQFIQTPQHEAANSLYTSEAELSLLFPDVKVGTTVVATVLIEEFEPVFPGEFAQPRTFGSGWPRYSETEIVSLPEALAERLKIINGVNPVPPVSKEKLLGGRTEWKWVREKAKAINWEVNSPNYRFLLPTIWMSTLDNWNEVGVWFNGLVKGRRTLGSELSRLLEEWTEGLKERDEIIEVLFEKVSNDVRYTGLEFGLAGYQPYSCEVVWQNQYGDCKDKANLLVSLLREKGIDAEIGLIQTRQHGMIEKRSPSWLQFNHAIVAVRNQDGSYLFMDPTIRRIQAGVLGFGDLDRDVLVMNREGAEWARTPDIEVGGIHFDFDLALTLGGELSGWVELRARGVDASYYSDEFNEIGVKDRPERLQRILSRFIPGGRVIDIDYEMEEGSIAEFRIRGYVLRDSSGAASLSFPYPQSWLPGLDEEDDRRYPYKGFYRKEAVEVTIDLPEGVTSLSVPQPFEGVYDGGRMAAGWKDEGGKLVGQLEWSGNRSILSATEFMAFRRAVFALKAWLDQSVQLGAGDRGTTKVVVPSSVEMDFPIMPTAEGQFVLLDERYPEDDFPEAYRKGLGLIEQWFPDDPKAVFEAKMRLLSADWSDDNCGSTEEAIIELLAKYGHKIDSSNRSWAQYIQARSAWYDRKDPEAIVLLRTLAEDTGLSYFRRGWSAYYGALFMGEENPAEALEFADVHNDYESEARESLDSLVLVEMARAGLSKEIKGYLDEVLSQRAEGGLERLESSINELIGEWTEVPEVFRQEVLETMGQELDARKLVELSKRWEQVEAMQVNAIRRRAFGQLYAELLKKENPDWWEVRSEEIGDALKSMVLANDSGQGRETVQMATHVMLNSESNYSEFLKAYRYGQWWMKEVDKGDVLWAFLSDQVELFLPDPETEYYNLLYSMSGVGISMGRLEFARKCCVQLMETADVTYLKVGAAGRLAEMELRAGNLEEAKAAYRFLEPNFETNADGTDYILMYVFLLCDDGEFDHALELIARIAEVEDKWIEQSECAVTTRHLLRAAENPDQLKAYWARQAKWWPEWKQLALDIGEGGGEPADYLTAGSLDSWLSARSQAVRSTQLAEIIEVAEFPAMMAKWVPAFTMDFYKVLASATAYAKKSEAKRLNELLVSATDELEPVDPSFDATGQFLHGAALQDAERWEAAIDSYRRAYELSGTGGVIGVSALEYWLSCAVAGKADWEEPKGLVMDGLRNGSLGNERGPLVKLLAAGYVDHADPEGLEALMRLEESPVGGIVNPELVEMVRQKKGELRGHVAVSKEFTKTVKEWMKSMAFEWYPGAPPETIDSTGYRHLPAPFDQKVAGSLSESIKANLLAALDEGRAISERQHSLFMVAIMEALMHGHLDSIESRYATMVELLGTRYERRMNALDVIFRFGIYFQRAEFIRMGLESEWSKGMSPELKEMYEARALFLEHYYSNDIQILGTGIEALQSVPLNEVNSGLIVSLIKRLVYLNQEDIAEGVIEKATGWEVDGNEKRTSQSYQLEWLRALRAARNEAPYLSVVRDLYVESLEDEAIEVTACPDRLLEDVNRVSIEERRWLYRRALVEMQFGGIGYGLVQSELNRSLTGTPNYDRFAMSLLDEVLAIGSDNPSAPDWFGAALDMVDIDKQTNRDAVAEKVDQFVKEGGKMEPFQKAYTYYKIEIELRLNGLEELNPTAISSKQAKALLAETGLRPLEYIYHYNRGQTEKYSKILDVLDFESIGLVSTEAMVILGLREINRPEEADLLERILVDKIQGRIDSYWIGPDVDGFADVLNALLLIGRADLLDSKLMWILIDRSPPSVERWQLMGLYFLLIEDWDRLEEVANEALAFMPDFYEFYGYRGLALLGKGKREVAAADFGPYLTYCRGSALFRRIQAAAEAVN